MEETVVLDVRGVQCASEKARVETILGLAALSMSGSSVIVAVNAVMLKRLRLPAPRIDEEPQQPADTVEGVWRASTA